MQRTDPSPRNGDSHDISAQKIGFVGLGRMGYPMAGHIAEAGFPLVVHDVDPAASRRFAARHDVRVAESADSFADVDIVLLMLPTSDEVRDVVFGTADWAGLSQALASSALVIDCSTSDPLVTREIAKSLQIKGISLVDAPVAGGVVFAEQGTLDILVAGDPAALRRAKPVVATFGRSVTYCGDVGSAHAMKVVNNFVNAQILLTYAEALAIALKAGLQPGVAVAALKDATTGRNHAFGKKIEGQVLTRAFNSGMALALTEKDVGLARQLAERLRLDAPIAALCSQLWQRGRAEVGSQVDQTEIVRLWERMAGIEIRAEAT